MKILKKIIILSCANHKNHENHWIPIENQENNETQGIRCQNHDNHGNHRIPSENHENHEIQ